MRTYCIACKTCEKCLWIGQGWPHRNDSDKPHPYKTELSIKALEGFLFSHQEHELIFGDDEKLDIDDFSV